MQTSGNNYHTDLINCDRFKHIDLRMRLAAEQGRNPTLWMLYLIVWRKHFSRQMRENVYNDSHKKQSPQVKAYCIRLIKRLENKQLLECWAETPKPNLNTFILGFENLPPMPDRQARPRSSAPGSRAATTDSGGGGPDEPDPDPDPERPYIALGIDHKATTPAGPPVPVSLRLSLYRIEMRYSHEGNKPDHPEP